jgi:NAD(P)-dependent dehydrogenase (short-subunit alcohol dehydrogenase family)
MSLSENSTSLTDLLSLKGKTALVTGGAGWLGSDIADVLAELGSDIIIASRDLEKCQKRAEEIQARHQVKTWAFDVDITDRNSVDSCMTRCADDVGGFDILVMCAWTGRKNSWDTINEEDWAADIEVCLNGVYRTIQAAHPILKTRQGVVLNIGSMYGHVAPDYRLYEGVPQANPPSYGAAKAGVIQFTKYLASFLAPDGIRVNCISPGAFPFPNIVDEFPEFAERLNAKAPLGRFGKPHELKGAAALLCSDAGSFITGQNLCVDGGWAVW